MLSELLMMPVPPFSGKIVHFYSDEALRLAYCQPTFRIVEALREKYGIESKCTPVSSVYSYWDALKEVWAKGTLIIIEQDIGFTEEQLIGLLNCKEKNCTFAYRLHPHSTMLAEDVWSIGENLLPYRVRLYTLKESLPDYCEFSGLGFIKLSEEAQKMITLDTPVHYDFMDLEVIGKMKGVKLHVHCEVEHVH